MKTNIIEELAKAQDQNSFLGNISHDIRTPMNAIIGYTDLAEAHIGDRKKVLDYLGKIRESSNYLLSLLNDLLDISRIQSGNLALAEAPENLSAILSTIQDIIMSDIQTKRLNFYLDAVDVNDKDVICDKARLSQVILNILSNSINYTPEGGLISMRVTELAVKQDGYATYEFHFKDNGLGMTKDFLKTIYDPFTRMKSTSMSGVQGAGLGMTITKKIVDMMGGTIDVKSMIGRGTEVSIILEMKLHKRRESTAPFEKDESVNVSGELKGKKILLVEDNELNMEIATAVLEEFGCKVFFAQDGDIAVRKIKNAKAGDYDLILMDICMPLMDGYQATREIRALGTEISIIPILAMTANAFDDDRKLALEAGMNEHITKPIDIDKLRATLSRFL